MKHHFTLTRIATGLIAAVLVLVPFHAFLTITGSSLVGHYTLLRLWDDVALLVVLGICCVWLVRDATLRTWMGKSLLLRIIVVYALLSVLLGLVALIKHEVTYRALFYGLLVNLRYLAWFWAVLLTTQRSPWLKHNWPKLLIWPAVLVIVFGVLQYTVLPHNLLSHVGYNAKNTIAPIETINNDPRYIRVMSTLRGANPLGAYLVVILSALAGLYLAARRRLLVILLSLLTVFALFASGSRSAWIGALLAASSVVWFRLHTRRSRMIFGSLGLVVAALLLGVVLILRHDAGVQNAVLHTQQDSSIEVSSNDAHVSAVQEGIDSAVQQPLGGGPGTSGPASVYNGDHARIPENYYIQIAQETGWLGLVLFLSILYLVMAELYQRRRSQLALVLLGSFIGLAFVCLLSHAWADDTLAFIWWGYAGIALGRPLTAVKSQKDA